MQALSTDLTSEQDIQQQYIIYVTILVIFSK